MINNESQKKWNKFTTANGGDFLQSWSWGELQRESGFDHWRLEEQQDGEKIGQALVIKRRLPLGLSWLYVPRGPIFHTETQELAKKAEEKMVESLLALAREQKSVFIKAEPPKELLRNEKWLPSLAAQPQNTLILDITRSEDGLLAAMHQKTRYNIRLAAKKGVKVRFSRQESDLEFFFQLNKEVQQRGDFNFHPDNYYKRVLKLAPHAELAIAEKDNEVLAVNLIVSFGDTATYAHGASSSSNRELMAPHLLQWECIRRAKNHGFKKYDFYGIAPAVAPQAGAMAGKLHPWAGITKFKLGFGGDRVDYPGAQDYVLRPYWYKLYKLMRAIKK